MMVIEALDVQKPMTNLVVLISAQVNGTLINNHEDFCKEIVSVGKTYFPIILDVVNASIKCEIVDI